jgi:hypothetical protein
MEHTIRCMKWWILIILYSTAVGDFYPVFLVFPTAKVLKNHQNTLAYITYEKMDWKALERIVDSETQRKPRERTNVASSLPTSSFGAPKRYESSSSRFEMEKGLPGPGRSSTPSKLSMSTFSAQSTLGSNKFASNTTPKFSTPSNSLLQNSSFSGAPNSSLQSNPSYRKDYDPSGLAPTPVDNYVLDNSNLSVTTTNIDVPPPPPHFASTPTAPAESKALTSSLSSMPGLSFQEEILELKKNLYHYSLRLTDLEQQNTKLVEQQQQLLQSKYMSEEKCSYYEQEIQLSKNTIAKLLQDQQTLTLQNKQLLNAQSSLTEQLHKSQQSILSKETIFQFLDNQMNEMKSLKQDVLTMTQENEQLKRLIQCGLKAFIDLRGPSTSNEKQPTTPANTILRQSNVPSGSGSANSDRNSSANTINLLDSGHSGNILHHIFSLAQDSASQETLYEVCNHHFQNIFHGLVQTQMHNQTDTLLHTCHNYIQQQIEQQSVKNLLVTYYEQQQDTIRQLSNVHGEVCQLKLVYSDLMTNVLGLSMAPTSSNPSIPLSGSGSAMSNPALNGNNANTFGLVPISTLANSSTNTTKDGKKGWITITTQEQLQQQQQTYVDQLKGLQDTLSQKYLSFANNFTKQLQDMDKTVQELSTQQNQYSTILNHQNTIIQNHSALAESQKHYHEDCLAQLASDYQEMKQKVTNMEGNFISSHDELHELIVSKESSILSDCYTKISSLQQEIFPLKLLPTELSTQLKQFLTIQLTNYNEDWQKQMSAYQGYLSDTILRPVQEKQSHLTIQQQHNEQSMHKQFLELHAYLKDQMNQLHIVWQQDESRVLSLVDEKLSLQKKEIMMNVQEDIFQANEKVKKYLIHYIQQEEELLEKKIHQDSISPLHHKMDMWKQEVQNKHDELNQALEVKTTDIRKKLHETIHVFNDKVDALQGADTEILHMLTEHKSTTHNGIELLKQEIKQQTQQTNASLITNIQSLQHQLSENMTSTNQQITSVQTNFLQQMNILTNQYQSSIELLQDDLERLIKEEDEMKLEYVTSTLWPTWKTSLIVHFDEEYATAWKKQLQDQGDTATLLLSNYQAETNEKLQYLSQEYQETLSHYQTTIQQTISMFQEVTKESLQTQANVSSNNLEALKEEFNQIIDQTKESIRLNFQESQQQAIALVQQDCELSNSLVQLENIQQNQYSTLQYAIDMLQQFIEDTKANTGKEINIQNEEMQGLYAELQYLLQQVHNRVYILEQHSMLPGSMAALPPSSSVFGGQPNGLPMQAIPPLEMDQHPNPEIMMLMNASTNPLAFPSVGNESALVPSMPTIDPEVLKELEEKIHSIESSMKELDEKITSSTSSTLTATGEHTKQLDTFQIQFNLVQVMSAILMHLCMFHFV